MFLPALATSFGGLTLGQQVAVGLTVAGGALGAASSVSQGIAANKIAKTQAGYLESQAKDELVAGAQEEARYRINVRRFLGTQRVGIGASGGELSGTALEQLGDTAALGEEDTLAIRSGASRRSFAKKAEASALRASGKNAKTAGILSGASTLLLSGTQAYGIWTG